MYKLAVILTVILMLSLPAAAQANLLQNGSFEEYDTTGTHPIPQLKYWAADSSVGGYNQGNWDQRSGTALLPATEGANYAINYWDGALGQNISSVVGNTEYVFSFDSFVRNNEATGEQMSLVDWGVFGKVEWLDSFGLASRTDTIGKIEDKARNVWNSNAATLTAPGDAISANVVLGVYWNVPQAVADGIAAGTLSVTDYQPANPTMFDDVNFDVVPEPSSMLLLGAGIVGMLSASRKKKKA